MTADVDPHGDDGEDFDAGHPLADPEQVARRLHDERRWLGSGDPEWHELAPDAHDVAVALIAALLDWLHHEGTEL